MTDEQAYKLSFTTGGLFQNESVEIARLYLETASWAEAVTASLNGTSFSSPKSKSMRRAAREIANRLEALSLDEIEFLVREADRQEQAQLLWLGICRHYRIIREFVTEVVRERFLSYQLDLDSARFNTFFESKAEWDDWLASISRATQMRARQVLFRTMREVGLIDAKGHILKMYLTPRFRALVGETRPGDLEFFPGASVGGHA